MDEEAGRMSGPSFSPRALLSLLFNASKGLDVVKAALDLGILARLDRGSVTLGELARETGTLPLRLYKLLDALETLGFVLREDAGDAGKSIDATRYASRDPRESLEGAARAVLGENSLERDRDKYAWRVLENKLIETLRGEHQIPRAAFDWPPSTLAQFADFEASMAAGIPPIAEAFRTAHDDIFATGGAGSVRWLDVGGGDGALAASVLARDASITADVFNLAITEPLLLARTETSGLGHRVGFVAGDFLKQEFPRGYDVISFVRVLHDWPADVCRMLLDKATRALAPGGRLVVCEEFRTPDRLAIQFFWTYFLIGVDSCVSRLREIDFYVHELEARGYRDIRTRRGPFDVLVATRT